MSVGLKGLQFGGMLIPREKREDKEREDKALAKGC
jgi:hypothetical protein